MTYSNGGRYNSNPLANPFNTLLGYANYTLNPLGKGNPFFKTTFTKNSKARLPSARMLKDGPFLTNNPNAEYVRYNELTVPDTTINNGRTYVDNSNDPNIFVCPDGTTINIDSKKVLRDPYKKYEKDGCWNNPNVDQSSEIESEIKSRFIGDKDINTYQSINQNNLGISGNNLGTSNDDYFKDSDKKNAKLYAQMSQEQKELFLSIPSMFPSKLIDCQDED